MDSLLPFIAPVLGFFLGTLLVSRVGGWVQVIASSRSPVVLVLHSGPWPLAATIYAAYFLLRSAHAPAWEWFFAGVGAAPIVWTPILIFLARRRRTP